MSSAETSNVISVHFTPEFKRNLRALSKKYRHIRLDIQPIIEQLQGGNFVGDQISGTGYAVFKVRVRNRDIAKGKRSGYRFIVSSQYLGVAPGRSPTVPVCGSVGRPATATCPYFLRRYVLST